MRANLLSVLAQSAPELGKDFRKVGIVCSNGLSAEQADVIVKWTGLRHNAKVPQAGR